MVHCTHYFLFNHTLSRTQEQFLISIDLAEFSRVFDGEGVTLEDLRQCSADELKVRSSVMCTTSSPNLHTSTDDGHPGQRTQAHSRGLASGSFLSSFVRRRLFR